MGKVAIDDMQVRAADAAGSDAHRDLSTPRRLDAPFYRLQGRADAVERHRHHARRLARAFAASCR
jgi:hypothetical protein